MPLIAPLSQKAKYEARAEQDWQTAPQCLSRHNFSDPDMQRRLDTVKKMLQTGAAPGTLTETAMHVESSPSLPAAAERWLGFLAVCLHQVAHPAACSQAQRAPAHAKHGYCIQVLKCGGMQGPTQVRTC